MGIVRIRDIIEIMNEIAPENTAAGFDNVGFLVGDADKEVTGIVLTLDCGFDDIDFAVANGCNLIITHHPLIFEPVKSVTTDTPVGKVIYKLISNGIALYSAHTNLDKADGGIDDAVAETIGMKNISRFDGDSIESKNGGFGRIGSLEGEKVGELKKKLSQSFGCIAISTADDEKKIYTAASCSGAGSSCIEKAIKHNADIFITGEVNYHAALDAKRMGLDIMLLSHQNSEQCGMKVLKNTLQNHLKGVEYNIRVILAPFEPLWR